MRELAELGESIQRVDEGTLRGCDGRARVPRARDVLAELLDECRDGRMRRRLIDECAGAQRLARARAARGDREQPGQARIEAKGIDPQHEHERHREEKEGVGRRAGTGQEEGDADDDSVGREEQPRLVGTQDQRGEGEPSADQRGEQALHALLEGCAAVPLADYEERDEDELTLGDVEPPTSATANVQAMVRRDAIRQRVGVGASSRRRNAGRSRSQRTGVPQRAAAPSPCTVTTAVIPMRYGWSGCGGSSSIRTGIRCARRTQLRVG